MAARRRLGRGLALAGGFALLALLALRGRFVPPVVQPGHNLGLVFSHGFEDVGPLQVERVEVAVASGERLRGVAVASDPGAPLVLHLPASGDTVARGQETVFRELAAHGFASLALDFRGVGRSEGARDPGHLLEDARAMWREAVRRAGGPERVHLRATSLGTVAAALLLEDGARPASVVAIAPVRPQSAAHHAAPLLVERWPRLAGLAARWLFRSFCDVQVEAALALVGEGVLAICSPRDELLPEPELEPLRSSLQRAGGRIALQPWGHLELLSRSRKLLSEELEHLRRGAAPPPVDGRVDAVLAALLPADAALFAPGSAARERLRQLCATRRPALPEQVAAVALASADTGEALRVWRLLRTHERSFTLASWRALADLSDPSGRLSIDLVEELQHAFILACTVDQLVAWLCAPPLAEEPFTFLEAVRGAVLRNELARLRRAVFALEPDLHAAQRHFARMALKARGIPERVVDGPLGLDVELLVDGRWIPLGLPARVAPPGPPGDTGSMTFTW